MVSTPDELRFDGQVAVISGAGGGLGRQYALLLAARGARVVVNDIGGSVTGDGSDGAAADNVADEIIALGGEAVADGHSVTTPDGGEAIVDAAIGAWGRVDILINNAGIVRDAPFEDITAERLDPLVDVHLKGAFNLTRPAWKVMREQAYGRILNTCSAAGLLGAERMSNYGAAKTGLVGLTRVLAAEGAERNIKVNAIAPIAYTRMLQHSVDTRTGAGRRRRAGDPGRACRPIPSATRPSARRTGGGLPHAQRVSGLRRDLHRRSGPRRALFHRQDEGLLQSRSFGRGRTRPPRRDPRRSRLHRSRRTRRRDGRAVRHHHCTGGRAAAGAGPGAGGGFDAGLSRATA